MFFNEILRHLIIILNYYSLGRYEEFMQTLLILIQTVKNFILEGMHVSK